MGLFNFNDDLIDKDSITDSFSSFFKKFTKEDNNKQDDSKTNKVYSLIEKEHVEDIDFIMSESNCNTFEECIFIIRYLENSKIISNMFIDFNARQVKKCSIEDEKLLERYSPFIFRNHFQIKDIVLKLPSTTISNFNEQLEKVYTDLSNLYDKGLLKGIKLNKVDKYITYYDINKDQEYNELINIKCPNCGANNDIYRHSKKRCEYCHSIVEDKIENYL